MKIGTIARSRGPATACLPWLLLWAAASPAQVPQEQDPLRAPAALTVEAVDARLAHFRALEGMEEGLKTAILDAYGVALQRIREGDVIAAASAGYLASQATAAQDLADARARLEALRDPELPSEATLADTEQRLAAARQTLQQAQRDVEAADQEVARRAERRTLIPIRLPQAQQELDDLVRRMQAAPETSEHPHLTAARGTRQLARRRALELELETLRQEPEFYTATQDLIAVRRQLALRQQTISTAEVEALQSRVQVLRLEEATREEQIAQQAARDAAGQHPLVERIAQENAELAGRRISLTGELDRAEAELTLATGQLAELERDFADVRNRVDQVGLTEAVGALLRQRRSQAPVPSRNLRLKVERRREEVGAVRLELFDFEDQSRDLLDIPAMVNRLLDAEVPELDPDQRESLRAGASDLLQSRRAIVTELRDDGTQYFDLLVQIDSTEHQILNRIGEYREYINQHVLWVRSSSPLWGMDGTVWLEAARWLTDPRNWYAAGRAALETAVLDPGNLLLLILGAILFLGGSRLRHGIRAEGALAAKGTTTSYWPTARALAYSILLALPFPVFFWTLGHALQGDVDPASFTRALGAGLERAGWILFTLEFLRQVLRSDGLGHAHFLWKPRVQATLRKNLFWLICVAVPMACVVGIFSSRDYAPWSASMGRSALMVGLCALTWFFSRTLHPRTGILSELKSKSGWLVRMGPVWFLIGIGVPTILFFMALLGYGFTALQLVQRLETTVAMLFVAFLLQALIVRALFLTHRKLAMERARERRRAAKEAQETQAEEGELPLPEDGAIDPSTIALQTRQLLRMAFGFLVLLGAWVIWVDVLPALGVMRQVVLWSDEATDPVTEVTLANLFLAVLIAFLTFLAARNISGFLEFVLLRRLKIMAGERHAITALATYAAVGIGIIASFSAIGIGWSKIQWLVAAMSVGLGFGLQEVVANFVSGVILLFERPIRVGDVVTVGETMGRVTKMRIRATTLIDWDRRELVVPNKEFVTARFTNWTLSDPITRITFPVGIAYGSDTQKAQDLLMMVARDCPIVLDEPKSRAIFRKFGESSLDFELRVFIKNIDDLPLVMNEINTGIDNAFRKSGIEIAFPQRDLHLRSAPAIVEHLGHHKPEEVHPVPSD